MSVKQKLEYGIFPIASRRHQIRNNFQKFPHMYTPSESGFLLISWILTPFIAAFAAAGTGYPYMACLLFMVGMNIYIFWEIKHN